jgi:hypothetical protein
MKDLQLSNLCCHQATFPPPYPNQNGTPTSSLSHNTLYPPFLPFAYMASIPSAHTGHNRSIPLVSTGGLAQLSRRNRYSSI